MTDPNKIGEEELRKARLLSESHDLLRKIKRWTDVLKHSSDTVDVSEVRHKLHRLIKESKRLDEEMKRADKKIDRAL